MNVIDALFSSNSVIFNAEYVKGYRVPIYLDIRKALSYPKERLAIIRHMEKLLNLHFPDCQMVAGTCTAGIPFAAMLAQNTSLPMCYVRSEKKNKGLGKQVEGDIFQAGINTVIIEDVVAHANSILSVRDGLLDANASISGVISIFSFNMAQASKVLTEAQVRHITLSTFEEVVDTALQRKIITEKKVGLLYDYRDHTPSYAWD